MLDVTKLLFYYSKLFTHSRSDTNIFVSYSLYGKKKVRERARGLFGISSIAKAGPPFLLSSLLVDEGVDENPRIIVYNRAIAWTSDGACINLVKCRYLENVHTVQLE